jgi:hypothetical protein
MLHFSWITIITKLLSDLFRQSKFMVYLLSKTIPPSLVTSLPSKLISTLRPLKAGRQIGDGKQSVMSKFILKDL